MTATRKPRSDARLKVLPEERQAEIAAMLAGKSLNEVRVQLGQDGIETSIAALSEFYSWYQCREALRRREARVETLLDELAKESSDIPRDKILAMGQSLFGAMAIAEEDPKSWVALQELDVKRGQLALMREKFQLQTVQQFLKWYEDKRAQEIAIAVGATNQQKIDALGQLMFGEDWKTS